MALTISPCLAARSTPARIGPAEGTVRHADVEPLVRQLDRRPVVLRVDRRPPLQHQARRRARHLGEGDGDGAEFRLLGVARSEEHTSELQSLMRISYAVFCLKKKQTSKLKSITGKLRQATQ